MRIRIVYNIRFRNFLSILFVLRGKSTTNLQINQLANCIQIQEVNKKAMLSKAFHNQFILLLLCQIYV